MMSSRWTAELLDDLRQIGDPAFDGDALAKEPRVSENGETTAMFRPPAEPGESSVLGAQEVLTVASRWTAVPEFETSLSRALVDQAQDLFIRYGSEVGAILLMASLPQSYAAESGARVLATSEALLRSDSQALQRRIGRTAQFLLDVMMKDPKADPQMSKSVPGYVVDPRLSVLPGGRGFVAARSTRLIHAHIRSKLLDPATVAWNPTEELQSGLPLGAPIHQAHQLGTYLSFCVTVWSSLERLGIRWSNREKEAYLHLWNWIAELMGIGTLEVRKSLIKKWDDSPDVTEEEATRRKDHLQLFFGDGPIRPRNVEDAEELLMMIRDRNWPAVEEVNAFQNAAGKQLTRALLDELEDAMPGGMQAMPLSIMRYLVDQRVSVALGLGGGGLPPVLANLVQGRSRGWSLSKANPAIAPAMRLAANQVSLHSFVGFMNKEGEERLRFEGIDGSSIGRRRRSRVESKSMARRGV